MTDLNIKYSELLPYLEQVDQIDSSVERSGKRSVSGDKQTRFSDSSRRLTSWTLTAKDWNRNSKLWRKDQIESNHGMLHL